MTLELRSIGGRAFHKRGSHRRVLSDIGSRKFVNKMLCMYVCSSTYIVSLGCCKEISETND